jgi:hypothetical protein
MLKKLTELVTSPISNRPMKTWELGVTSALAMLDDRAGPIDRDNTRRAAAARTSALATPHRPSMLADIVTFFNAVVFARDPYPLYSPRLRFAAPRAAARVAAQTQAGVDKVVQFAHFGTVNENNWGLLMVGSTRRARGGGGDVELTAGFASRLVYGGGWHGGAANERFVYGRPMHNVAASDGGGGGGGGDGDESVRGEL